MESVKKSSNNPFFKSKYADLAAHLDLIEPLLEKNGCLLLQPTEVRDGRNVVISKIYHVESGEFVSSEMMVDTQALDMQKAGAGVTYARRFTLNALVAMTSEDDDGNFASNKTDKKTTQQTAVTAITSPVAQTKSSVSFAKKTTVKGEAKDNW